MLEPDKPMHRPDTDIAVSPRSPSLPIHPSGELLRLNSHEGAAMIGLRYSSPLVWLGVVLLFFLPWIDIRCSSRSGRPVEHLTISGAQMAWGGATILKPENERRWRLGDASLSARDKEERRPVTCLLSLYLLGLLCGLGFAAVAPTTRRAVAGMLYASVLLGLLVGGCWWGLEHPVQPEGPQRIFHDYILQSTYTPWYYGSYLLNCVALLLFVLEYGVLRRRRRRQAALSSSVGGGF